MAFKITPDIVKNATKRVVQTRRIEPTSAVVEAAKDQAEGVKNTILENSRLNRGAQRPPQRGATPAFQFEDLRNLTPKPKIKIDTPRNIVPEDNRPKMFDESEFRLLIQDSEARPEDFVPLRTVKVEKTPPSTEVIAAGKRYFSVDNSVFGPRANTYSEGSLEDNNTFVEDPLRGRAGKYWTLDRKDRGFVFVDRAVQQIRDNSPYTFIVQEPHNDREPSDFGRTRQWVAIRGNRDRFKNARNAYSRDYWSSFIRGGRYEGSSAKSKGKAIDYSSTVRTGQIFFDHSYDMPVPFNDEEIKEFQVPQGALVAETKHEYNFYIEDYEKTITRDRRVRDNTLPNLYVFMSELRNEEPNPEFRNFITLDDTLATDEQFSKVARRKIGRKKFDIKEHPIGQYFDIYGRQYGKAVENGASERLDRKFSNIAVPLEEIDLFNKFNEKSEMFPMLMDLSIGTDRTTTFAQILADSQLTNDFMARVINRHIANNAAFLDAQTATETIVQRAEGDNKRKVSRFESVRRRVWDVADLVEELREGGTPLNPDAAIFLGNHEQEVRASSSPQFKFFKSLMFTIFLGKFQSLVNQKFRTFDELMTGEQAYSETVMYRISKHEFGPNNAPIQNIWLPNSNEIDVLRYLDTQVKYNKRYVYKVWAYQLVIGTKYWYTNLDADSYDHHASFMVNMEPSVQLVETPYVETTLRVTDKPPVPPDIDIIPYKGVDNEMLFYMKGNVGEFDADPVLIQPTDQAVFNTIRESQKKKVNEKITFGSDDPVSVFQIFRIDQKPRSYDDFTGNLQAQVRTDVDLSSLQKASSAAFVDELEPNRKYYYTIRSIDVHSQLSNPTPVFEVEIINENGLVFPTIRCVEFEKMPRAPDKPARRFVQIVPTVLQSLINEEQSGYEDAETAEDVKRKLHLGVASDAVWDKKFKIRITSKSTGKKVELLVGFEHKNAEKA